MMAKIKGRSKDENFKENQIPIITQGHEFTIDGETVKIKIND